MYEPEHITGQRSRGSGGAISVPPKGGGGGGGSVLSIIDNWGGARERGIEGGRDRAVYVRGKN